MSNYLEEKIRAALEEKGKRSGYSPTVNVELKRLVLYTGLWIERLAGKEAADQTMAALCNSAGQKPADNWRDGDSFQASSMMIASILTRLETYGVNGAFSKAYDGDSIGDCPLIVADLAAIGGLMEMVPDNWLQTAPNEQEKEITCSATLLIYAQAIARYRLDTEQDLTLDDIALLSNLSPKSVLNATQRKRFGETRLGREKNNLVNNQNARDWLQERNHFKPTQLGSQAVEGKETLENFVFIPCTADGIWFLPSTSCIYQGTGLNDGIYIINSDLLSESEFHDDYFSALEVLTNMKRPIWCYYNDKGKQALAKGTNWVRRNRQQLLDEHREVQEKIRKISTERLEEDFKRLKEENPDLVPAKGRW